MQVEKVPDEILTAFKVSPIVRGHNISVKRLKHVLCETGEKLTPKEFDELKLNDNSQISYNQFVNSLVIPRLDH